MRSNNNKIQRLKNYVGLFSFNHGTPKKEDSLIKEFMTVVIVIIFDTFWRKYNRQISLPNVLK